MPLSAGSVYQLTDAHRFELLVDTIADYAIYMLDAEGIRHELEYRRGEDQGL